MNHLAGPAEQPAAAIVSPPQELAHATSAGLPHWLQVLPGEAPEVQEALCHTLREVPVLMFIELAWTASVAGLAWQASAQAWPLAWLALEAVCLLLLLGLRCRAASPQRQAWQVGANVTRLLGVGLGAMATLWLGDMALTLLALALVIGMLTTVVSRGVALPGVAVALVYLLGAGLVLGFWGSPLPGLKVVALMVPVGAMAFHLLTLHNHRLLVSVFRLQFENRRLSLLDPLTGLPNRRQFSERLKALEQEAGPGERGFALLCLDLDGFKQVNDRWGHDAGDQLLTETARRLGQTLRAQDLVCRVGGDEFVVLLPGADHDTAGQIAQRLLRAMGEPFALGAGEPLCVGLSIGIAVCPQDGRDTQALLRQADEALYRAKHAGKGCFRWAARD